MREWLKTFVVTDSPAGGDKSVAVTGQSVTSLSPPTAVAKTAMDLGLDDVFANGGAASGRNSADTLLKLHDGLASFPPEQRLAMIRAMDMADNEWDEDTVVADARHRIAIAENHLKAIDADELARIKSVHDAWQAEEEKIQAEISKLKTAKAMLEGQLSGLERKVADSKAQAGLKSQQIEMRAAEIKTMVSDVATRYRNLVEFFTK